MYVRTYLCIYMLCTNVRICIIVHDICMYAYSVYAQMDTCPSKSGWGSKFVTYTYIILPPLAHCRLLLMMM